jgi:hypothetical protein
MRQAFKAKGLTLVELVLSLLLLSVVILTGVSMELGTRRIFSSTDTEAQLLQEATPIMALVSKIINRGIGQQVSNPPLTITSNSSQRLFSIRIDSNNNSRADANDIWVNLSFLNNSGGVVHQLWYYPNRANSSNYTVLSRRVIFFDITNPVNDGYSNVTLTLRRDPDNPVNSTNQEVTVQTSVQYLESSVS